VCQFANVSCGGIQALADRGYLQVAVRNAGYIDASFTISVESAQPSILPAHMLPGCAAGVAITFNHTFWLSNELFHPSG
jgi:hypothetical protein